MLKILLYVCACVMCAYACAYLRDACVRARLPACRDAYVRVVMRARYACVRFQYLFKGVSWNSTKTLKFVVFI